MIEFLKQCLQYLAVGLIWWIICFVADILIYNFYPEGYKPSIKGRIRLLTYGFPAIAMLLGGLITKDLVFALIFLSAILVAVACDFFDSLGWAEAEMQPGRLD